MCKEAGFDAIEVMAGLGGILSRFMALATNNRTDEYGGSLENRVKLTLEVIRGVREVVGPEFPIVVRWSPIDFIKSPAGPGLSMEDALRIAPMLEEAGCDLHDLSVGWHETSEPLTTKAIEDGHWTFVSQQIKTVAKKPVAQGYRNTDPRVMEQNLQDGKLDVVAGLRYSIADPALPRKVMEDRTCDMRLCIVCCRCLDDVVSQGKPLNYCGVNPRLGEELDHEAFPQASKRKKVMVVGSGPAGINAALTAAQRGHAVDLYEEGPRLGGCVKMSSIFSPYHERYLDYLLTQVKQHPQVTVHLKTKVTPETVRQAKPDAAIVAVGGKPLGLDVPGADGKNVVSSHDFLEMINGHKPAGKKGAFNSFMWGAGDDFSSGGDLDQGPALEPGPEGARKTLRRYLAVVRTIRTMSKPVVAMVDGYAVGGAFALVCASDLVCASERALFVPAFCQIGIVPEMGMMKLLPDLVGAQRAKELLFFGGKIPALQLYDWGVVNRVFPTETLEADTLWFARQLAGMPDASIHLTKNIMNALADGNLEACLEAESTASPFCTTTKAYAATMEKFAR